MSFLQKLNPYARLTKDKQEQSNMEFMSGRMVLLSGHHALPGNVDTNFSNSIGITPEMSAPYNIPWVITGPLATLLVSPYIDRVKRRIPVFALITLLSSIQLIATFMVCLGPDSFRTPKFVLVNGMIWNIIGSIMRSPSGGMDGAVMCRVMHNSVRGRYISLAGMGTGIMGVIVGSYVIFITKYCSPRIALLLAAIPSVLFLLSAIWCTLKSKELPDLVNVTPSKKQSPFKDFSHILGMKEFRIMMPANFLRGLGDGVAGYAYWIALKRLDLAPEYAGYVTILNSAAPFVAYLILGMTMDRFGAGIVIPASDILLVIGMMGIVLTKSPILFLCYFTLRAVMFTIESSAIPLAHYEVVPNEVMGAFTALRLLLLNLTTSISGVVSGILLAYLTPVSIFAGSAALKLVAGALYCYGVFALQKHVGNRERQA